MGRLTTAPYNQTQHDRDERGGDEERGRLTRQPSEGAATATAATPLPSGEFSGTIPSPLYICGPGKRAVLIRGGTKETTVIGRDTGSAAVPNEHCVIDGNRALSRRAGHDRSRHRRRHSRRLVSNLGDFPPARLCLRWLNVQDFRRAWQRFDGTVWHR